MKKYTVLLGGAAKMHEHKMMTLLNVGHINTPHTNRHVHLSHLLFLDPTSGEQN